MSWFKLLVGLITAFSETDTQLGNQYDAKRVHFQINENVSIPMHDERTTRDFIIFRGKSKVFTSKKKKKYRIRNLVHIEKSNAIIISKKKEMAKFNIENLCSIEAKNVQANIVDTVDAGKHNIKCV